MVEESRFESSASFEKWTFINVQKRKAENSFKNKYLKISFRAYWSKFQNFYKNVVIIIFLCFSLKKHLDLISLVILTTNDNGKNGKNKSFVYM